MKFVWNSTKTGIVNFDEVRNITLSFTPTGVEVIVWFSDKETYLLGKFSSNENAIEYLEKIHKEVEEK